MDRINRVERVHQSKVNQNRVTAHALLISHSLSSPTPSPRRELGMHTHAHARRAPRASERRRRRLVVLVVVVPVRAVLLAGCRSRLRRFLLNMMRCANVARCGRDREEERAQSMMRGRPSGGFGGGACPTATGAPTNARLVSQGARALTPNFGFMLCSMQVRPRHFL